MGQGRRSRSQSRRVGQTLCSPLSNDLRLFIVRARLLMHAVAEVTSEVFLKVAKAIRSFPGTTSEDFRRWLFQITTNEINAHLRRSKRQRAVLDPDFRVFRVFCGSSYFLQQWDTSVTILWAFALFAFSANN